MKNAVKLLKRALTKARMKQSLVILNQSLIVSITEFELNELFEAMGNFLNMDIYNRSKLMMNNAEYKKFTEILPTELYLKKFNYGLVNFLIFLSKDKKGIVNKRLNQIAMIIEQVLATRSAKFIGLLSFSQVVVKWSLSGSKTAHTIDRVSSASGSITTL